MIFLMDPEFWARVLGIIVIDLTLAGDNARAAEGRCASLT